MNETISSKCKSKRALGRASEERMAPRRRWGRVLFSLLLAMAACAHRAALPVLPPPSISTRKDEIPPLPLSTLTIPLAVPLSVLEDVLRQRVLIPSVPDWTQITAEGESPEVGIRYQAELGSPQIAVTGSALRTTLPIHYFGSLRARAHSPFGWLWLTKNTSWGTNSRRGTIELQIESQLTVSPNWELSARSSLSGVNLTAPDVDKLCGGKVFKVCIPAELVRERVHRELDKQVRDRATHELAEVDAQVASRVNLRGMIEQLWNRLQEPVQEQGGEALLLNPQGLALGPLAVRGDALVSAFHVSAQPRWSTAQESSRSQLPASTGLEPTADDVHFDSFLAFSIISDGLSGALATIPANQEGYRVQRVELLGAAEAAARWIVAITLGDEHSSAIVYGDGALVLEERTVRLGDLQLSAASSTLATALGYEPRSLVQLLSSVQWALGSRLDDRLTRVHDVLARGVSPWPVSLRPETRVTLQAAYATEGGIMFRGRAH